ncbi:MAG: 16S rRNA (guanine(966)-N(2))-methyltransferase RsmD [Syntrophaceae bacterium]
MRISAGQYRSRRIVCPKGIRPTTDRVKQALFSALTMNLSGLTVLDLFSGSGSLGIEALSRGAAFATFIETAGPCLNAIHANLAALDAAAKAAIIKADVRDFVMSCTCGYDLILMDPPYDKGLASQLAPHVYRLIKPGGVLVIEHSPRERIAMELWKAHGYGDTMISFIQRPA